MNRRTLVQHVLNVALVLSMMLGWVSPVVAVSPSQVTGPTAPSELANDWPAPELPARHSASLFLDPVTQAIESALGEIGDFQWSGNGVASDLEPPMPAPFPSASLPTPFVSLPASPDPLAGVRARLPQPQDPEALSNRNEAAEETPSEASTGEETVDQGMPAAKDEIAPVSPLPVRHEVASVTGQEQATESQTKWTIYLPIVLKLGKGFISPEEGGMVATPDQKVTVTFHPHGLPEAIMAAAWKDEATILPANLVLMGPKATVQAQWLSDNQPVIELDPEAQTVMEPDAVKPTPSQSRYWATVSIRLREDQKSNDRLAIARLAQNGEKWEILPTQIDSKQGVATAETDRLGTFALIENAIFWLDSAQSVADIGDEIIVDDGDAGFVPDEHDGSVDYFWSSNCGAGGCWNGDALWTYNRSQFEELPLGQPWNWVKWTPVLPEAGYYYIEAWIPADHATTAGAEYEIHHDGQVDIVTVNQAVISGDWKKLNYYWFAADGSEYVYLDDVVPEEDEYPNGSWSYIGFDAVKFVYAGTESPPPIDTEPPVITLNRWLDGNGGVLIEAHVTDNVAVGEVVLVFNGVSVDMTPAGGDLYQAILSVPANQLSDYQIVAVDTSYNVATFPPGSLFKLRGYTSRNLGRHNFTQGNGVDYCDEGNNGCVSDPVNTANGNFTYYTTDLTVPGIGDTDIAIERNYNSLPNEPQGTIHYFMDGDTLVEEPLDTHPEPFGPDWTFSLGPSLLVIDNALFHGVQVRYADGHTVNFSDNGGGTFTSVETRVYDQLNVEGSGYLLKTKELMDYYFDADGHLMSITDRNGNTITLTYDGDRLIQADNSAGRWVRFEYNNNDGLISDIYAPKDVHLQYGYQDGRLVFFSNARTETTNYQYDSDGQLEAIVTPKGHPSLRLSYDHELGRVAMQIIGEAERYAFAYDDANRITAITDAYGNRRFHVYDEKYRLIESSDALEQSEYYGYNDLDNRTYFKDREGNEWFYTYDDRGNRLTQDGPLGWHNEFVYNDLDLVTYFEEKIDDSTVFTTTYSYDTQGNLEEVCNPYHCSTVAYEGRGLPTELWDFAGNHTLNTYDTEGDLIAVTNAETETTRYDHDALGRTIQMTTPLSYTYTYAYDGNDNLTDVYGPLGYHLGYTYDANDNLETETDPNDETTRYTYDASENLVAVTNPLTFTTVYTYGLMNEMTGFQDAEGRVWTYGYDELLHMTDIYGPLDTHTHFDYDAVGNITDTTDAEGHVTHTEYDDLYRPESVTLNYIEGGPVNADTNVTTSYEYDLAGNVLREVDAEGNPTEYTYDLLSRLTLQRSAEGQEWEYEYDPMGNVTSVINPRDYETTFDYDGVYRLQTITDAQTNITTFDYDDDGNLTDETDPEGVVTHYEYNELDRAIREVRNYRPGEPEDARTNVTTEYEYDLAGNLRFVTEPRDYRAEYRYDAAGRLVDSYDYEGAHTHFTYDRVGNLLSVTDDNGYTTSYTYDDLDRRTAVTNAEGHSVEFTYDKVGNLTDILDARLNLTHFDVDALGRTVHIEDTQPGHWYYEYDRVGNLLVETDANVHATIYTYDDVYRQRTVTDAEGYVSEFRWDANDNLVEFIDGNTHSTIYTYDELDRLWTTTNAEGETTGYRYDPLGNQTHLIEPDSTVTLYDYDPLYRLNAVTEHYVEGGPVNNDTNILTRYTYDASGNLHEIINANEAVTTFEHDGMGRLVREVDPLGNTWQYTYDGVGNRHTRLDANGDLTEYIYWPDNQLRRIDYHKDGTFVSYTYDENNNRIKMVDWLGTTIWNYDELNRLTDVTDPFGRALRLVYDAVGNRIDLTYPDGKRVAYTYYDNDWLKTTVTPGNHVTAYTRDGVGNIIHIANTNATVTDVTYDHANRTLTLVNRQTEGGQQIIAAFDYTYNDLGHVTQVVNEYGWRNPAVVTETYSYDGLRRLAGMADSDGTAMSYTYDAVGNRLAWATNDDLTTQTPLDGFSASYDYNAANQLITATIDAEMPDGDLLVQFAYDANGNRTGKLETPTSSPTEGTDYAYDAENRLLSAQDYQFNDQGHRTDRAVTTLEYDGGGRRLAKTYDPKEGGGGQKRTEYVFDGLDPVAEYDLLNGQHDNYYRGALNRIVMMHHFPAGAPGQRLWYHYNFKGDVVGLTRQHGQSTHNYRYDPYGGVVPAQGNWTEPHNHYTLTGKEYDEHTGLVYFGARHYDGATGVWMTQDIYRGEKRHPVSLHTYLYTWANPVTHYDAYGREVETDEAKMEILDEALKEAGGCREWPLGSFCGQYSAGWASADAGFELDELDDLGLSGDTGSISGTGAVIFGNEYLGLVFEGEGYGPKAEALAGWDDDSGIGLNVGVKAAGLEGRCMVNVANLFSVGIGVGVGAEAEFGAKYSKKKGVILNIGPIEGQLVVSAPRSESYYNDSQKSLKERWNDLRQSVSDWWDSLWD